MDRPLANFACRVLFGSACVLASGCGQTADRPTQLVQQRGPEHSKAVLSGQSIQRAGYFASPRELQVDSRALPIEAHSDKPNDDASQNQTVAHGGAIEPQGPSLASPATSKPGAENPYFETQWPSTLPAINAGSQQSAPRLLEQLDAPSAEISGEPAGTSLPWVNQIVQSPEMQAVEERANAHIHRGMELGGRGATYSARAEFIQALQIIAGALDVHGQTRAHSEALAAGLRAIEEAEDFVVKGSELEAALDLRLIIDSHRTPVCQGSDKPDVNPMVAIQSYYTYAQEQLSVAAAQQSAGSSALYALGRLQMLPSAQSDPNWSSIAPKAVVFYQAALAVNPKNALAANEVGVLLARFGRYQDAKNVLLHGAMGTPQPASWHNLAVIHRKLGEVDMAERAEKESKLASQARQQRIAGQHTIEWVAPEEFAQGTRPSGELRSAAATNEKPESPAISDKKTAFEWLPWSKSAR